MANADHNLTRDELVRESLAMLGVNSPSTNEIARAVDKLNSLMKLIDVEGRWLWAIDNTESTLSLVVGQSEYAAGTGVSLIKTDILDLEYVAVLENSNDRNPIEIMRKTESMYTSLKDDDGEPIRVFLEKAPLLEDNKMIFYPVPNVAFDVVYTYKRRLYDFDLASDNPDMPAEWQIPLQYNLAYHLSFSYGLPLQERLVLKGEAKELLDTMRMANYQKATKRTLNNQYF